MRAQYMCAATCRKWKSERQRKFVSLADFHCACTLSPLFMLEDGILDSLQNRPMTLIELLAAGAIRTVGITATTTRGRTMEITTETVHNLAHY